MNVQTIYDLFIMFLSLSHVFSTCIYTLSRMALGRVILSHPTDIADSFIQNFFPFTVLVLYIKLYAMG